LRSPPLKTLLWYTERRHQPFFYIIKTGGH
jgi:hypothetical protein